MTTQRKSAPARPDPANAAPDWGAKLQAAGLRRTPARIAVLQALSAATAALSHAELEAALPEPMDRVTLYRVLDSLVEAGLAMRQVGDDRTSRFSVAGGGDHSGHSHFHCSDCGRVYCMPTRPPRQPSLPEGFALEGVDLRFRGHCPDCVGSGRAASR